MNFCKERRRRTKENVVGDTLDAIDREFNLVIISNDSNQDVDLLLRVTEW